MANSIKAEVITIGDEILFGQITDTNTQWIGTELTKIGIRTVRKSSVGDDAEAILQVLSEAHQRANVIIITGGLGPTKDDITKQTLCRYFNTELVLNERALAFVTAFFERRGRILTDINRTQAYLPANATYIENQWGTAPGMWFEHDQTVYISLPGVPFEMKNLMSHIILPRLKEHFHPPVIQHKIIRTVGIGESFLAERIEAWEDALPAHIRLAYLPSFGGVKLRLTATGSDEAELNSQLAAEVEKVLPLIEKHVYGYDDDELEVVVGNMLKERNLTLGVAESCTGGQVAATMTKIPGVSACFWGGIVSYSNPMKVKQLGVKQQTLDQFGAVSEQTIIEMAEGVRKALDTHVGIATSGIAGPDGGTPDKPVGTVWIACATDKRTVTRLLKLSPHREQNITLTTVYVLNLLREELKEML